VIAVIINPISGTGGRIDVARARAAQASALLASRGSDPSNVFITERGGHAREIALNAIGRGISTVVAWGGDGTMNEVGAALAFSGVALALVPSGSGNGLARELGIPFAPSAALDVAFGGVERTIDAGEISERLFFNIAGVGLDADVAHRFAASGHARRGLSMYVVQSTAAVLFYRAEPLTLSVDGAVREVRPLLIAFANARQYGNGALIAPRARVDDGRLDVVVVDDRPLLGIVRRVPALFKGELATVPGVSMETAVQAQVTARGPIRYHVDGEPCEAIGTLAALVRPAALTVSA